MTSKEFRIRTASTHDLPAIAELKEQLDEYHQYPNIWPAEGGRRQSLTKYRQLIRGKTSRIFVAERSPKGIVGYMTAAIQTRKCTHRDFGRIGIIGETYVEETYRRLGVGKTLVKTAVRFFSKQGIRHVTLRNVIANKLANRFWGRLSFKPVIYIRTTSIHELMRALRR